MSHFKGRRALLALVTVLLSLQSPAAFGGGKAEPGRVAFQRGRSSASLRGSLQGAEEAEYTFGARAAQRVTLTVSATPADSIVVAVTSPSGAAVPLQSPRARTWTCLLSEGGDHVLVCRKAHPSKAVSQYTLTVAIQ